MFYDSLKMPVALVFLTLALFVFSGGVVADDLRRTQSQIEKLQSEVEARHKNKQELTQAEQDTQNEIARMTSQSVNLTAAMQKREQELIELQGQKQSMQQNKEELAQDIHEKQVETAFMIQALVNLSLLPTEALLLSPDEPVKVVRTYSVLGETVPALKEQAEHIADKMRTLDALNIQIAEKIIEHRKMMDGLRAEQKQLADLMRERQKLLQTTRRNRRDVEREMADLNAQSQDLSQLLTALTHRIENLQSIVPTPSAKPSRDEPLGHSTPQSTAQLVAVPSLAPRQPQQSSRSDIVIPPMSGNVVLPASGRLVRDFGQRDNDGVRSQGITLETVSGAAVVAPMAGRVRYAGFFRSFNNVVIIEHQGGYFSMISGMEEIYVDSGVTVVAGEPIGVLSSLSEGAPTLYYEIRKNGKTLNPRRALHEISGGAFKI